MLGWIRVKMVIQESALGDDRFFTLGSTIVGNSASACNDPCTPGRDYSTNNHEARAPPSLGFPHTMLSVKRMKHNMQLTFIKKLFNNCKIGTNV
jgi:hypothetical protein